VPQRIELPDRFPLYAPLAVRDGELPLTKDARLYNGYVEFDPSDKQYWIYKRPGLGPNVFYTSLPTGGGFGIYQSSKIAGAFNLFSVIGGQVFSGPGLLGPVDNPQALPFTFETINGNPLTVIMVGPYNQYLITPSIQSIVEITSAIPVTAPINLPTLTPGVAYLDGTTYVMDTNGNIYGSNLNDGTTWNPLNVIAASATSDQGVALAKQLTYILAFKQSTTQVFFNNSNPAPGSPLSPVPDSQIPLGCFAPYSVKGIDNSILWVSSNETVSPQVVQLDALVPKIVSTPAVEKILDGAKINSEFGGSGIIGWVLKHGGHRFYGLNIQNLNLCLVYDIDQQAWYIWTDPFGNAWPVVGTSYQGGIAQGIAAPHVVQTSDGKILNVDTASIYPNDNGVLFPVDIYTPNFDGGVDKSKMLSLLRFHADQTKGSTLNIRYNDSDYETGKWSNFRNVDLGLQRPYIDDEGSFYRRAYHLRHLCNTRFRIKSGSLLLGLGTL
jgi:hypothetical protein